MMATWMETEEERRKRIEGGLDDDQAEMIANVQKIQTDQAKVEADAARQMADRAVAQEVNAANDRARNVSWNNANPIPDAMIGPKAQDAWARRNARQLGQQYEDDLPSTEAEREFAAGFRGAQKAGADDDQAGMLAQAYGREAGGVQSKEARILQGWEQLQSQKAKAAAAKQEKMMAALEAMKQQRYQQKLPSGQSPELLLAMAGQQMAQGKGVDVAGNQSALDRYAMQQQNKAKYDAENDPESGLSRQRQDYYEAMGQQLGVKLPDLSNYSYRVLEDTMSAMFKMPQGMAQKPGVPGKDRIPLAPGVYIEPTGKFGRRPKDSEVASMAKTVSEDWGNAVNLSRGANDVIYGDLLQKSEDGNWHKKNIDWNSPDAAALRSRVGQLLLNYKELYKLGALQASEQALIKNIGIADPTSMNPDDFIKRVFAGSRYDSGAIADMLKAVQGGSMKRFEDQMKARNLTIDYNDPELKGQFETGGILAARTGSTKAGPGSVSAGVINRPGGAKVKEPVKPKGNWGG
jgi:hypothetical protein